MMYYLFGRGIDQHQNSRLERWEFQKADTTFSLIRWKKTNRFSILYSLDPGSSSGYLEGTYENDNGKWILKADSMQFMIDEKGHLIGFRNETDTIEMKKTKR